MAIASLAFASLYVLREWQKYHSVESDIRPGWILGDANYYTLSAVLCIPLALCLIRQVRAPMGKCSFAVRDLCRVIFAGVTAPGSLPRRVLLGLMASLAFAAWHSANRLRYAAVLGLLVVPILIHRARHAFPTICCPDFQRSGSGTRTDRGLESWPENDRSASVDGRGVGQFQTARHAV